MAAQHIVRSRPHNNFTAHPSGIKSIAFADCGDFEALLGMASTHSSHVYTKNTSSQSIVLVVQSYPDVNIFAQLEGHFFKYNNVVAVIDCQRYYVLHNKKEKYTLLPSRYPPSLIMSPLPDLKIRSNASGYQPLLDSYVTDPVALSKIRIIAPKQWNYLSHFWTYKLIFFESLFRTGIVVISRC